MRNRSKTNKLSSSRRIIEFPRVALLIPFVLFLAAICYPGIQSIRLKWWVASDRVKLQELTPDEKAADMRYLLDLIGQISQVDAVWQAAGLENPLDQSEIWIERARLTGSNSEFADLVLQLLVHAG